MTALDADLFACRLCSSGNDLVDVGNEKTQFAAEYRNIVKIMTGIRIYPNDTLLSSICRACLKRAIENYDYRRSAIQRNFELQRKRERLQAELRERAAVPVAVAAAGSVTDNNDAEDDEEVELVAISMDITTRADSPALHDEATTAPAPSTPKEATTSAQNERQNNETVAVDQSDETKAVDKNDETKAVGQNDKTKPVDQRTKKRKKVKSNDASDQSDETMHTAKKNKMTPQTPEPEANITHGKRAAALDASCRIRICKEDEIFGNATSSSSSATSSSDNEHQLTETVANLSKTVISSQAEPEKTTDIISNSAVEIKNNETKAQTYTTPITDKPRLHSSIRRLQAEFPNLLLPEAVLNGALPIITVQLTRDAVKQHIIKLGRRLRRRARNRKRTTYTEDVNQRMDIPDIMPTTSKELKELVTSSLGLLRIAPSPAKALTPSHPAIEPAAAAPESSFEFPQKTPKKSILHPALTPTKTGFDATSTPVKYQPLMEVLHNTPTKSPIVDDCDWAHNSKLASPIDTEYSQLLPPGDDDEDEEAIDMVNSSQDSNNQPDYSLIQIADEEAIFICDQCHKVFENKGAFMRHRKVHLRCVFCNKTFANQSTLKKHVRVTCRKVTRRVNVRVVRMETDKTIRDLLPQWFFDKIRTVTVQKTTASSRGKPPEDVKSEEETAFKMVVTAEIHAPPTETESNQRSSESSVLELHCEELSDVESMHLIEPLEQYDIKVEEEIAPSEDPPVPLPVATLQETAGCVDELRLDEANFLQRLLHEPKLDRATAQEQVTHKDFVGVENTDQTLLLKNLGQVLKSHKVIPVNLKFRPKRLKVRIADYAPPVEEEKFYDFSRMKPVSLQSYKQMITKRTIYNFSMPTDETAATPAPPTHPVPPMPRKHKKKSLPLADNVKKRSTASATAVTAGKKKVSEEHITDTDNQCNQSSCLPGLAKVVDNVQLAPYTPEMPETPATVDKMAAQGAQEQTSTTDTPPMKNPLIKILTPHDINNKNVGIQSGNASPSTPHAQTREYSRPRSTDVVRVRPSAQEWKKEHKREARAKQQQFVRLLPTSINELQDMRRTSAGMALPPHTAPPPSSRILHGCMPVMPATT